MTCGALPTQPAQLSAVFATTMHKGKRQGLRQRRGTVSRVWLPQGQMESDMREKAEEARQLAAECEASASNWVGEIHTRIRAAELLRECADLLDEACCLRHENDSLKRALNVAKAQIVSDRDLFIAYNETPMLLDMLERHLKEAGPRSCNSALAIIDSLTKKVKT
jgi:hypothetical protein